jgi:hypothetical protein
MNIYTTLSFLDTRLARVKLMVRRKMRVETLIKACLKRLAPKIRSMEFSVGALTYQPVTFSYETVHFSMSNAEYEIYMDLKRVSKCTLSLLVAIALDLYAERVLADEDFHSYQNYKYFMCKFVLENESKYIFCWNERDEDKKKLYKLIE